MDLLRRSAIRQFLFASSGAVFIPTCMQEEGKASIVLETACFTRSDESLLAAFCETLLPASRKPGAIDIGAHYFVMKMIDSYPPDSCQQKLLRGLRHLNKMANERFGKTFTACSVNQRNELLSQIEVKRAVPGDVVECLKTVKDLTLQAYVMSEYYLSEVFEYQTVSA